MVILTPSFLAATCRILSFHLRTSVGTFLVLTLQFFSKSKLLKVTPKKEKMDEEGPNYRAHNITHPCWQWPPLPSSPSHTPGHCTSSGLVVHLHQTWGSEDIVVYVLAWAHWSKGHKWDRIEDGKVKGSLALQVCQHSCKLQWLFIHWSTSVFGCSRDHMVAVAPWSLQFLWGIGASGGRSNWDPMLSFQFISGVSVPFSVNDFCLFVGVNPVRMRTKLQPLVLSGYAMERSASIAKWHSTGIYKGGGIAKWHRD